MEQYHPLGVTPEQERARCGEEGGREVVKMVNKTVWGTSSRTWHFLLAGDTSGHWSAFLGVPASGPWFVLPCQCCCFDSI